MALLPTRTLSLLEDTILNRRFNRPKTGVEGDNDHNNVCVCVTWYLFLAVRLRLAWVRLLMRLAGREEREGAGCPTPASRLSSLFSCSVGSVELGQKIVRLIHFYKEPLLEP